MRVVTAPELYYLSDNEVSVFLAGGIQKCSEWQKYVIQELNKLNIDNLVVFNPRRDNFSIGDPNAAEEQIKWEFQALQYCDIFSMYFDEGESDQPICMYELGRNLVRMQHKFLKWKDHIVITANPKYKRYQDVIIQTKFATGDMIKVYANLDEHIEAIVHAYYEIKE